MAGGSRPNGYTGEAVAGSGAVEREAVEAAVGRAIDQLNEQLPPGERVGTGPDARLYGDGAPLDSLGLVNLIVLTEEAVQKHVGEPVALGDQALDDDHPFVDVRSLVDHLVGLLTG